MLVEHTAIKVGNAAINCLKFSIVSRIIQPSVKQNTQKTFIETVEKLVITSLLLCPLQFITQIVWIKIQKAFLLNKVAEHQSVQHHRGVPLLISLNLYALNKRHKRIMLFFETCIEVFGYLTRIHLKSFMNTSGYIYNSDYLVDIKTNTIEFTK